MKAVWLKLTSGEVVKYTYTAKKDPTHFVEFVNWQGLWVWDSAYPSLAEAEAAVSKDLKLRVAREAGRLNIHPVSTTNPERNTP